MKLNDLSIGTLLKAGFGIILLCMILLGANAWLDVGEMWDATEGLHNHPIQVRRAIVAVNLNVSAIQINRNALFLADNKAEWEQLRQRIDWHEAEALRNLNTVYQKYLGPKEDVVGLEKSLLQWKPLRNETLHLLQQGHVTDAKQRIKSSGVEGQHLEKMTAGIERISDFAIKRSDAFYRQAYAQKKEMNSEMLLLFGVILLLSGGVVIVLLKGIRTPIKEITSVAEAYRLGDLTVRSMSVSKNELGTLSASFNHLAETVQAEIKINESTARISEMLLWEEHLHDFCRQLLKSLLEHTGSQMGAVYLLNEEKSEFLHCASIGLHEGGRASFSALEHDGEFGAALAAKSIQHITDIPSDTPFTFITVSGEFRPREILTIPVLDGKDVIALISLASVKEYSAISLRVVEDTLRVITARMISVLALRQIRAFSEQLDLQNRELREQKTELSAQADELSEQNIELALQKKQLDEANRLKSSFLSNMSHELRTPLNSVIALSGVLGRRLRNAIPAEEYGYIDVIERNGKHLLMLINDILDLSRIESGREELSLCSFSLRDLVSDILETLTPQSDEKGLLIQNRIAQDLPSMISDPAKCRHILQNVIGNAVKFTDSGTVDISATLSNAMLEITVADTGIGIAADRIHLIFDEFRQADESMSKKYGGTGLGLAIAKKYTAFLQGTITVSSTLGEGSVFTIRLPLSIANAGTTLGEYTASCSPVAHGISTDGSGKTILLVEDSEPAIIQIKDILLAQGYRVLVARNGREALEQISETIPDGMILDLMMPEVDGFEVLKTIRNETMTSHLPVLILTAKQITREDLSFLKVNHIHQLIQKGDVGKAELLAIVAKMVSPACAKPRMDKPPARRTAPSQKPVILIVEDNADNMLTVKALLGEHYTIVEAVDGESAVQKAQSCLPDLIVMDISLPGMNGYQAFDAIRNDVALKGTPIVAMTANVMKGNRENLLNYGFDGYISKPIDEQLMLRTIEERLDGHGA